MSKNTWNEKKIAYLKIHFPTGYNEEIADELDISISTLKRMARKLGLKKREDIANNKVSIEVREEILKSYESHSLRDISKEVGISVPTIIKIVNEAAANGFIKRNKKDNGQLISAKRKKMLAWERTLAIMGFEAKTRLRVMPNRKRWRYREQLKRSGYHIRRNGTEAYVYVNTVRHKKLEKLAKENGISIVMMEFHSLPSDFLELNGDAEIQIAVEEGLL